jgi:hypothetical protein
MTNTLAYYNTATITSVKGFIVQAPGVEFTAYHFLRNLRMGLISLCISHWQYFPGQYNATLKLNWLFVSMKKMFVGKARSLSYSEASEKCFTRVGSNGTRKHELRLERLAMDKRPNLFQTFVNYGRKKLYNIGPSIYK